MIYTKQPMTRHFYRFDVNSDIGRQFRKLWNECAKAERAAESFAKKVGARTYYSSPSAFTGGVECVSFQDGAKVNKKLWRMVGKDADGLEQWVPDVKRRSDVMLLPRRDFKPSDTATRIYGRRVLPWPMVRHLRTLDEWMPLAQVTPSGDAVKDAERVDETMRQALFVRYTELYRDDEIPADPTHPRRKMPLYIRESIRIERARLTLPVVKMDQFHQLLQADKSAVLKDGKPIIVQESTPTFFEYDRRYYLGIDYPCRADGLTELSSAAYVAARENILKMQRDLEALASSEAKGN